MKKHVPWACVPALLVLMGFGAGDAAEQSHEERIAELEAKIEELEAMVRGKAEPINLGRTSLARVCASSVNGARSLANKYYGILNAFDDGNNWIGHINYTYWLSGGDSRPWIEVAFDHPVSVASVLVEGAPPFTAQFDFVEDGQQIYPENDNRLDPETILHGVTKVRLTFEQEQANVRVHEIRIMGYVHPDITYTEGKPRLLVTDRGARAIAKEAYRSWLVEFLPYTSGPKVRKEDGRITFTYHRNGLDFVRITVDTSTGDVKVNSLLEISNRAQRDSGDALANDTSPGDAADDKRPRN